MLLFFITSYQALLSRAQDSAAHLTHNFKADIIFKVVRTSFCVYKIDNYVCVHLRDTAYTTQAIHGWIVWGRGILHRHKHFTLKLALLKLQLKYLCDSLRLADISEKINTFQSKIKIFYLEFSYNFIVSDTYYTRQTKLRLSTFLKTLIIIISAPRLLRDYLIIGK